VAFHPLRDRGALKLALVLRDHHVLLRTGAEQALSRSLSLGRM